MRGRHGHFVECKLAEAQSEKQGDPRHIDVLWCGHQRSNRGSKGPSQGSHTEARNDNEFGLSVVPQSVYVRQEKEEEIDENRQERVTGHLKAPWNRDEEKVDHG